MAKNLVYPLKHGYDTWKMLSHECISWVQFETVIDNILFDKRFKEVRIMERHLSIKIKWVGNSASIPQIGVRRPTRGQHHG